MSKPGSITSRSDTTTATIRYMFILLSRLMCGNYMEPVGRIFILICGIMILVNFISFLGL